MSTLGERLRNAIGDHLVAIEDLIGRDYRLALVARHTTNPKAHIFLSIDEPDVVIATIRELLGQADHVLTPGVTAPEVGG